MWHSHLRIDALRASDCGRGGGAQKVEGAEWQSAIDVLIGNISDGRIAAGFVAAIERCGAVLAAKAPPDGSANELPDRLYVM